MRGLEARLRRRPSGLLLGVLLLAQACGSGGEAPGGLQVERAEIGLMPGEGPAVAYVTVTNRGEQEDRLVAVESPLASQAELHESIDEDGVVRMIARPEGFEVPAGEALALEPGGKHIMLFEPRRELVTADGRAALTLHFEHAGAREVEAAVLQVGSGGHADGDHSQMDHGAMDHSQMDHGAMNPGDTDSQTDHGAMHHGAPEASEEEASSSEGTSGDSGQEASGA